MNLTNLRSNIRYLVFGKSDNTAYSDTDIDRNLNNNYETVLNWVIQANGDWEINGEIATTDIVANQRDYTFDSSFIKVKEIYIKSTSTGEYVKANKVDVSLIDCDPETYHPSIPEYDLSDNQMYIYLPGDITNVTDGIKLYAQTDLTKLVNASDSPNLPELVVNILSLMTADDYCVANEMWNKSKALQTKVYQVLKPDLQEYYAHRFAKPAILTPASKNYH